jgi:hypothetical protein
MTEESADAARRWARLRGKLTYANTMATIAAFLALGGIGYAATDGLRALNRDQGRPLWSGRSYVVSKVVTANSAGSTTGGYVLCDEFDVPIGGGFGVPAPLVGKVAQSHPYKLEADDGGWLRGWSVTWVNDTPGASRNVTIQVRCADFVDLHEP